MTITELQKNIQNEYAKFCELYDSHLRGDSTLLNEVSDYLAQKPGKRLRPLLVLLSAKACQTMHPKHILLALTVETLHNATLMHDDVVDESDHRRGQESVRRKWGNQVAVLCGDYYLSKVMSILKEVSDKQSANIINDTVSTMCIGELEQLDSIKYSQPSVETYINIIGKKTASLMAACCELGARNFEHPEDHSFEQALHDFGYHYGIVFQIHDDINDMNNAHDIGLPESAMVEQLLTTHTQQAREALAALPESEAKTTLLSLLLPDAPQPV